MTDRGLPIVDGAPACPFVAFAGDRDARATSPDQQHRCYAEVRPAPRALAHQEAYCLSSAFPVCPTFQDWAKREAAKASSGPSVGVAAAGTDAEPDAEPGDKSDARTYDFEAMPGTLFPSEDAVRNPPRDWTSPPPWAGTSRGSDEQHDLDEREAQPTPGQGGLSGSFADRIVGGHVTGQADRSAAPSPSAPAPRQPLIPVDAEDPDDDGSSEGPENDRLSGTRRQRPDRPRTTGRSAPSWERPPRREAYPTIKTRMGLNGVSVPPLLIGVAAVVIAAVALFTLPALLGVGNPPGPTPPPGQTASPAGGGAASATPSLPTPVAAPTPQIYVVQAGDTMSRIANRFGVPLQVLIDANKLAIPEPDRVDIGQEVIIPAVAPTLLPNAGSSVAPSASP